MAAVATHNATRWFRKQCACEVCEQAAREQQIRSAERRRARLLADPTLRPHGVINTYGNWGCRCDPCLDAWSAHTAGKRPPTVWHSRGRRPRIRPFGREWIDDASVAAD